MDFSEKWGTDVDTAVQLALADLKLSIDEVDVTVLEEPSRGFFGIGSKLALVRVEKKKPAVKEQEPKEAAVKKPEKVKEKVKVKEKEVKTVEIVQENIEPEVKLTSTDNHVALSFLKDVTREMGLSLDIECKVGKDLVYLDIEGKDSGTIIGKRGQTLDAIQYLTSLVVNKDQNNYTRVVVDAENYRQKREKTLEQLANRLASKVQKTKRSVKLEPMNPYERKVIHATLQNHPYVTTRSEGQDPYRRVIVELK